eukprot:TRINITY_DN7221_c1_g1_i2.p1 TRINITY_DN7221_c1_g1~~TRINITY_DN7221_c1_g1_i2.p1  ORF type:complete len:312 (+),score=54.12 TRINITY_DN7221_c1_g1_i2:235-1170(+)
MTYTHVRHINANADNCGLLGGPVGADDGRPEGIGCATGAQNVCNAHTLSCMQKHYCTCIRACSRLMTLMHACMQYPLRGGKGSYFQGGVRGTSWVYSNQLHPSRVGTTNYELTHVTDWLPTLVEAAGGNPNGPWPKPLDGVSQYDMLFNGQPSPRETVLINIERDNPTTAPCQGPNCATHRACNGIGQYAVIKGNYKMLLGGGGLPNTWYHDDHPYLGNASVPQGGCIKACCVDCCDPVPYVQVFDVINDEGEHNNLAMSRPDLVDELMTVVHMYNNSEYVEALFVTSQDTGCPYNDDRGVLTPCVLNDQE